MCADMLFMLLLILFNLCVITKHKKNYLLNVAAVTIVYIFYYKYDFNNLYFIFKYWIFHAWANFIKVTYILQQYFHYSTKFLS